LALAGEKGAESEKKIIAIDNELARIREEKVRESGVHLVGRELHFNPTMFAKMACLLSKDTVMSYPPPHYNLGACKWESAPRTLTLA